MENIESERLNSSEWLHWGPYLSERQWGTVREDYSEYGSAWDFFTHDHSRSRTYRWGEDGIAGISDNQQHICFSFAFWNKKDAILKERLFGLTGNEGNHSEDVKELYYYQDSSPSHSYMKFLYKYPIEAFPYEQLVSENAKRNEHQQEFEIYDTSVFKNNNYFDIEIEYAKQSEFEILIALKVKNISKKKAQMVALPTIFFRNIWAWDSQFNKPILTLKNEEIHAFHPFQGNYKLVSLQKAKTLFTENETNATRLFGLPSSSKYVKDAFHEYLIDKREEAINPENEGTKACFYLDIELKGDEQKQFNFLLVKENVNTQIENFDFEEIIKKRRAETELFYSSLQKNLSNSDYKSIQREAWAGMLWSKQYYNFNIKTWLEGDINQFPPPEIRKSGRNSKWKHINNHDIISMPDKWEYPWYAAWDLAFHCIPFAHIDVAFAKNQLLLFLNERYQNDFGQIPAYEWAFGDVNPPVHAYGALKVYQIEKEKNGKGDLMFLKKIFIPLVKNYTWWLNTKALNERLIFGGGFLGLDNVGVLDRGAPLPDGAWLEQVDGTCWMALFSLSMMEIALELSQDDPIYESEACYFARNFFRIARDINHPDHGLWNGEESFFNDVICFPSGKRIPLEAQNIIDVMSIYPISVLEKSKLGSLPLFVATINGCLKENADWMPYLQYSTNGDWVFSLLSIYKFEIITKSVFDESKFLSKYGIRSLSKEYELNPKSIKINEIIYSLNYKPAESDTTSFGENSNWRGPIWFPVNYVLIDALEKYYQYLGSDYKVNFPSFPIGQPMNLKEIVSNICYRLASLFKEDSKGNLPIYNSAENIKNNPTLSKNILFYEYFDGNNGSGCGASHQTGWTGLVADLIFKI